MLPLRICCTSVNESSFMQSFSETFSTLSHATDCSVRKTQEKAQQYVIELDQVDLSSADQDSLGASFSSLLPSAANSFNLPISAPIQAVIATKSAPQLTKSHPSLNLLTASSAPSEKYPANFPLSFAASSTLLPATCTSGIEAWSWPRNPMLAARSLGPMNRASIPGTAAMEGALETPRGVSICTIIVINVLAFWR